MTSLDFYMHKKVVTLHEQDTVLQAAKAMAAHRMGCVMVVDGKGEPSGLVTDRDLMKAVLAENKDVNLSIGQVMSRQLHVVTDEASLNDVIRIMKDYGVRRVPVVVKQKSKVKCIGIVTLDDLLARQEIAPDQIAQIIKAQIYFTYLDGSSTPIQHDVFLRALRKHLDRPPEILFEFAKTVFESIFRRLHYSSAVQFMLQLPKEFQDIFVHLPAGPDRSISASALSKEVARQLAISPQEVPTVLRTLWSVLDQFGDSQQLEETLLHMPTDIQDLFMVSHPLRFLEIEP